MKKFEYLTIIMEGVPVNEPFKKEGEEGWELVGFTQPSDYDDRKSYDPRIAFIFKREKI